MKPIRITLPGGDYVAGTVQWRWYKRITKLAGVSSAEVTLDDWYNLAGLVVNLFGDRFGINELKDKTPAELIAVLNQVVSRVNDLLPKQEEKPQETSGNSNPNWITALELSLVNRFGWSLHELDLTDVESLLPFIDQLNETGNLTVFADQVDWL